MAAGHTAAAEKVTFCLACGNNVHAACIATWVSTRTRSGLDVSCPLCREAWVDGSNPQAAGGGGRQRGYQNLAHVSDAHRGGVPSLEEMYGDRSIWIRASAGEVSRREAANAWNTLQGR
jgi:hypothetical protein